MYARRASLTRDIKNIVRPPKKQTVVEFVEQNMKISVNGTLAKWDSKKTPYLIEPMNCIDDNSVIDVELVAAARTGKTEGMMKGGLCYSMFGDYSNTMFVDTTKDNAEEFTKDHIQPLIENSPSLKRQLTGRKTDYTLSYIRTNGGNHTKIRYPVNNVFKSKTLKRVFMTEFSELNVSDGDILELAKKRTTTYGCKGFVAVEGTAVGIFNGPSPSCLFDMPVLDSCNITKAWQRTSKEVYHWRCPHCNEYFIPDFNCVHFDREETCRVKAARDSYIACSECGSVIDWTTNTRYELNLGGKYISKYGNKDNPHRGFRVPVLCSAFDYNPRENVVSAYIDANNQYKNKGITDGLKAFYNTTLGIPFCLESDNSSERKTYFENEIDLNEGVCPEDTICLLATVDVQGGDRRGFEYAVFAIRPDDRHTIIKRGHFRDIQPQARIEHWKKCLVDNLLEKWFPVENKGYLKPFAIAYDCNGEAGVFETAKDFKRSMPSNISNRLMAIKGAGNIKTHMQEAKDRSCVLVNTNLYKDQVYKKLHYSKNENNSYQFHRNFSEDYMLELSAEQRNEKGKWVKVDKKNETLDLFVYGLALHHYYKGAINKHKEKFYCESI